MHKKGEKTGTTKPVSLITTFFFAPKICEKVMQNMFSQHLHINNILVPKQYGFRQGTSTEYSA